MREVLHWAIEVFFISAGVFALWVIVDSLSIILKGGK
jgi:hypothetical protein